MVSSCELSYRRIVPLRAALDVMNDRPPLPAGIPLILAFVVAGALTVILHLATGIQNLAEVLAPFGFAAGTAVTLFLAELANRRNWRVERLVAGYALLIIAAAIVVINSPPAIRNQAIFRFLTLFRTGGIFETRSLFDPRSAGYLAHNFFVLIALPSMGYGLIRSLTSPRWLVPSIYSWYFLLLAALQVRFLGELAAFLAIFASYSLVAGFAWTDLIASVGEGLDQLKLRIPDRRAMAAVALVFLLIGGIGGVQATSMMDRLAVDDPVYDAGMFIANDSEQRNLEYPENYVLSDWGDNRFYNYFVNGQSLSYTYAQENYTRFAGSTSPGAWYERFDDRVGYIVLAIATPTANPNSTIYRLTRNFGSADDGVSGLGHYRVRYRTENGRRTVVSVVGGANLTGTGQPGERVAVRTEVEVPGVSFVYRRHTLVNPDGTWSITVAHPGRYDIRTGNESTTVMVSTQAVRFGGRVAVD